MQEVNQELWELAVENVKNQQEEAFEGLFNRAIEEHIKGECRDCENGLCSRCEDWIASGIENWQERQFDEQAEAEYGRLEELRAEQQEQEMEQPSASPDAAKTLKVSNR